MSIKVVTLMYQYLYKTGDQCSQVMKKTFKEVFENNMHHYDTIKAMTKAYLSNRECFVLETVYYILQKLKLRELIILFKYFSI